uniref:Uncharacterized protein n=1 Tax=Magallana gigas TaxID=29159 RepID=K1RSL5_MAGGI
MHDVADRNDRDAIGKVKPNREGLTNVDIDKLVLHWKHHAGEELLRSNIEEETIRCPDNMDDKAFDDFARECLEATFEIPSSWTETTIKQKLYDCVKKCIKKKWTLVKMGPVLEEHNRLRAKEQELTKRQKKMSKKDLIRVNDEVEQERKKVKDLERQLKQIAKEKEYLLTRLTKIAGSKLTNNNPDIADLNDDNRPTKLAEKFGQLYDDEWTDSMEELTEGELRLDDRAAIGFLLRIIMV